MLKHLAVFLLTSLFWLCFIPASFAAGDFSLLDDDDLSLENITDELEKNRKTSGSENSSYDYGKESQGTGTGIVIPASPPKKNYEQQKEATQQAKKQSKIINPRTGLYVDLSGAFSIISNSNVSGTSTVTNRTNKQEYETGYGISGAFGYRPNVKRGFLKQTRYELQGAYRDNELGDDGITPVSGTTGNLASYAFTANAFYDAIITSGVTPYVGLGIGIVEVELEGTHRLNLKDDTDTAPAYQFLAGFTHSPTETGSVELRIGYSYLKAMDNITFSDIQGGLFRIDYENHNIEGGVRLFF